MFNLQAIISVNAFACVLLVCLFITMRRKFLHGLIDDKAVLFMLMINLLQCIIEPTTFALDGKDFYGCKTLLVLLNSLLYINTTVFSFAWVVYVFLKVYKEKRQIIKMSAYFSIPAALVVVMTLINIFVPILFKVDSMDGNPNVYKRMQLYFIPVMVTFFYLLSGVFIVFKESKKSGRYLFFPTLLFLFPVFCASTIEVFFYGHSFIWAGTAIGLMTLCINLQKEISSVDVLSGLYTRQYLTEYLSKVTQQMNSNKKIVGVFIDIDNFKTINDTHGHLVGDDAIRNIGEILRRSLSGRSGFASRYAGDEFLLVFFVKEEKEILEVINDIQLNTIKFNEQKNLYNLSFSLGYAVYGGKEDSIEEFIKRMDKMMNDEKRRKHIEIIKERD